MIVDEDCLGGRSVWRIDVEAPAPLRTGTFTTGRDKQEVLSLRVVVSGGKKTLASGTVAHFQKFQGISRPVSFHVSLELSSRVPWKLGIAVPRLHTSLRCSVHELIQVPTLSSPSGRGRTMGPVRLSNIAPFFGEFRHVGPPHPLPPPFTHSANPSSPHSLFAIIPAFLFVMGDSRHTQLLPKKMQIVEHVQRKCSGGRY